MEKHLLLTRYLVLIYTYKPRCPAPQALPRNKSLGGGVLRPSLAARSPRARGAPRVIVFSRPSEDFFFVTSVTLQGKPTKVGRPRRGVRARPDARHVFRGPRRGARENEVVPTSPSTGKAAGRLAVAYVPPGRCSRAGSRVHVQDQEARLGRLAVAASVGHVHPSGVGFDAPSTRRVGIVDPEPGRRPLGCRFVLHRTSGLRLRGSGGMGTDGVTN